MHSCAAVATNSLWPPRFLPCTVNTKDLFHLQVRGDVRLKNPHINNSNMRSHFLQSNAAEAVASAVKQHEHQSLQPICSTITHPADRGNEERIKKLEHRVSQLIKKVHS